MSATKPDVSRQFHVTSRTPAVMRKAIGSGDPAAIHDLWSDWLSKPARRFLRRRGAVIPLSLWSVEQLAFSGRERELAATVDEVLRQESGQGKKHSRRKPRRKHQREATGLSATGNELLLNWLVEAGAPLGIWERLLIAETLLTEHSDIPADVFVRCLALLNDTCAQSADAWRQEADDGMEGDDTSAAAMPTMEWVCHYEAEWTSSLLLSPLGLSDQRFQQAADELSRTVLECTDQEGLLHGSLLPRAAEFLAPLIRAVTWSQAFQLDLWNAEATERFQKCVRHTGMMAIPGGRPLAFHRSREHPAMENSFWLPSLQLAARVSGLKPDDKVRRLLTECSELTRVERRCTKNRSRSKGYFDSGQGTERSRTRTPKAISWQSDISSTAFMRSSPAPCADAVVMEWHTAACQLHVAAGGVPVLQGEWLWRLGVDDRDVSSAISWNCTCWFTDEEVLFAELEAQELPGVRLIRHVLLSTVDHFAIMTDTVSSRHADSEVRYQAALDLADGVTAVRDTVTRELTFHSADVVVRGFPLWLPDDRIQGTPGRFAVENDRLLLQASGRGGVTVPVVLDWNPGRRKSAADWSRLTVCECRRTMTSQAAGAGRIRIGDLHLLIYRSLQTARIARTVLGLHTADESVYGRVGSDGQVSALVQVEPLPADSV